MFTADILQNLETSQTGEEGNRMCNRNAKERVLVVLPDVPFPIVSGGHMRDAQILHGLHEIGIRPYLLYFGAGEGYALAPNYPLAEWVQHAEFAGPRCERPDRSLISLVRRKFGYVVTRIPGTHPFSYQYDAIRACDIILEYARRMAIQVIILRSFWCHYAARLRGAGFKVIANCPDYNPLLAWEMVRSIRNPFRKVGPLCNYAGVRRLEEQFLPLCNEVWAPTLKEADAVAQLLPRERILLLPNLVDVGAYPDLSQESSANNTVLFVANYSYSPNANAAKLLLDVIFPALRSQASDATLLLVGHLPATLADLGARCPGVEVHGFANDLISLYRRTSVVLLPVTEGAGMLFKAVEALAVGKPVVGFQHAFRGIPRNTNVEAYLVADSPEDMARQTSELLVNAGRRRTLGSAARAMAETSLSWEAGKEIMLKSRVLNSSRATHS